MIGKRLFSGFVTFICCVGIVRSQEAVVSSDASVTGANGSVSFSIGQVFFNEYTNATATLNQGVQQPYEIFVVSDLYTEPIRIDLSVFPNPVKEMLHLQWTEPIRGTLSFQLFDQTGRLWSQDKLAKGEAQISLKNTPSAIYFLKILVDYQPIQTFKILKK